MLFDDPDVGRRPEPTYTVAELGTVVATALHRALPDEVWVTGEIHDLARPQSGHVYFTLVGVGDEGERACLSVILSARARTSVNAALRRAGGAVRMTDGTEVRIRGRVDWYGPRGQVQLRMTAVDPSYTLGQLELARAELLARLEADGLLDANRRRPLPVVPLRVGLVTSVGSAAEADVLHELTSSGFAFHVLVADCRVQGPEAPRSIAAAIAAAAAHAPDVVVLARGGGARTDLAAFDHEVVARAIATCPVPVITGVGHEIDRSVADDVAHLAAKTPTAGAQVLVARIADYLQRLGERWQAIATRTGHGLDRAMAGLRSGADRAVRASRAVLVATDRDLADRHAQVAATARRAMLAADERVARDSGRVHAAARVHVRGADSTVGSAARRLLHAAPRGLGEATRAVDALGARVRAHDPERVLARGWSITRGPDGAVVRQLSAVAPGDELRTLVAGGEITSVVAGDHNQERSGRLGDADGDSLRDGDGAATSTVDGDG